MSELVEESTESNEKTLQQKLEEVKQKLSWMDKQLLQPDSVLRGIYSTDSAKKDFIVTWAEALEEEYEYECKLKVQPIVEEVGLISTFIINKMKGMGLHRLAWSHTHKVLGHKYKNATRSHKQEPDNIWRTESAKSSSNTIANYELENQAFIQTLDQQISFLKILRAKARTTRILAALDYKQRLQYEDTNLRIQATQLIGKHVIDDRQSVPMYAQLKLVMAIVAATNNFAVNMYVAFIKRFGVNKMQEAENFFVATSRIAMKAFSDRDQKRFADIFKNMKIMRKRIQKIDEAHNKEKKPGTSDSMTPKQGMKIVFGLVTNVLTVFDHKLGKGHKDRDAALMDGHYGLACPECGSYRVRERPFPDSGEWLCFCYDCEWWFEARTVSKCLNCHIPLFDEILEVILKTAKPILNTKKEHTGAMQSPCPRCKKPLILPAKMFRKTKLRGQ